MVDGVCVCVLVCGITVGPADLKALLVSRLLWVLIFLSQTAISPTSRSVAFSASLDWQTRSEMASLNQTGMCSYEFRAEMNGERPQKSLSDQLIEGKSKKVYV